MRLGRGAGTAGGESVGTPMAAMEGMRVLASSGLGDVDVGSRDRPSGMTLALPEMC